MKKNSGWKRAGCVLLAAQMTVSVLPMESLAAYGGDQGRSGAILAAVGPDAQRRIANRGILLDRERMPVFSKRTVALITSGEAKETISEYTGAEETPTPEAQGETVVAPASGNGGEASGTPEPGGGEATPVEPEPGGGEETPMEPEPDGGEETPVEPEPDGGEETPVEPEPGGGEELPTEPEPDGGEETPVEPEPGEVEEPPGELEPPSEDPGLLPPGLPEELPAPPAQNALSARDVQMEILWVNVYKYTYWVGNKNRDERERQPYVYIGIGGAKNPAANIRYIPYRWEVPGEGGIGDLDEAAIEAEGYMIAYMPPGDDFPEYPDGFWEIGAGIRELPSLTLDGRVPDMKFEGWVYSQVNPADGNISQEVGRPEPDLEKAMIFWNGHYYADLPSEPFEAVGDLENDTAAQKALYEAVKQHADQNLSTYDPEYPTYVTNVVAKWVPSDRADLTELKLYTLSTGKTGEDNKKLLKAYGGQTEEDVETEYDLQVPVDIDRLTLDFTSYEPGTMIKITADTLKEPILYRYDREDYIWDSHRDPDSNDLNEKVTKEEYEARNRDGDSILKREQPGKRTGSADNDNTAADYGNLPSNSYENPARANWSLPAEYAIPLEFTSPKDVYNDITITVVAPDGSMDAAGNTTGTTETYTLHVRRMADPEMELNPGNTPYGMLTTNSTTAGKDEEKKYFGDNRAFNGAIMDDQSNVLFYPGQYGQQAWAGEEDLDLDETALVVYQDATFTEPGFRFKDSQGETVTGDKMQRSIQLRKELTLTTGSIREDAGEPVYYKDGILQTDPEDPKEAVVNVEGKDEISIKGMNIAPGIYTIEYSYDDPVSKLTYNSVDKSVYLDKTKADNFSRPLVVLPQPGDVDMDGMVTLADAILLEKLLEDRLSFVSVDTDDRVERLFKYRVCDVDRDGQVTQNDVDTLKGGYVPKAVANDYSDYFYFNSGDSGKPERLPLTTASASADKASLSVDYLGSNIAGVPTGKDNDDELLLGETFWLGVKLENTAALPSAGQGVEALEFTLVYNPDILEPGLLQGTADWRSTMEQANLTTAWSGYELVGNSGPTTPSGGSRGAYVVYPQQAQPTLPGAENRLGTYTLAIQTDGAGRALSDGYQFYIPFRMKTHPAGVEHDTMALVEPLMGGREFSLTYVDGSVSAWRNQTGDIFGGATENLRDYIAYTGSDEIPIGEDKTPYISITDEDGDNAVYGDAFTGSYGELINSSYKILGGELPPGMEYDSGKGLIYTPFGKTAEKAGVYRFYIGRSNDASTAKLYQIVVDKAPLTLSVGTGDKFYGQANPTIDQVTFYYDLKDLKAAERAILQGMSDATQNGQGLGSRLQEVLGGDSGYKKPAVKAVDTDGRELTQRTPASKNSGFSDYTLCLTGGEATNYAFRYVDREGKPADMATNGFRVMARPLVIDKVNGPVATIYSNAPDFGEGGRHQNLTASYAAGGSSAGTYVATLTEGTDRTPLTGDPILAGDEVLLSYSGAFQEDPDKGDNNIQFELTENQELRDVAISNTHLDLTGADGDNYQIWYTSAIQTGNVKTTGMVRRALVTKVILNGTNIPLDYKYGDFLALANLGLIQLEWEDGTRTTPHVYNPEENPLGISLCWVGKKGDKPTDLTAAGGQYLDVKLHNGKYLCVYVSNGAGNDPACAYIGPISVAKADLTLTVDAQSRYYGEPEVEARITYQRSDLVGADLKDGNIWVNGSVSELENNLAGFTGLTVSRRETASVAGKEVARRTDAGSYFVVISGATADNYNIKYVQNRVLGGTTTVSGDFGCAPLSVRRRPIRVTGITGKVGFLYDDDNPVANGVRGTWPKGEGQLFEVKTVLPTADYYVPKLETLGSLTGSPILEGDTVTFRYRASYDSDSDGPPYFDLDAPGWNDEGTKAYDATVDRLEIDISGNDAGRNYQLAYTDYEHAINGWPVDRDGEGDVVIRRITGLEVAAKPVFMGQYTYGDRLQVEQLQVRVKYGEGSYVSYKTLRYNDFARSGLKLEWAEKDSGKPAPSGTAETAEHNQLLTVVDHDGRYLVVRGQRHSSHKEFTVVVDTPITVGKKTIQVAAKGTERAYGEDNLSSALYNAYQATVAWDQLIESDRDALTKAGFTADDLTFRGKELGGTKGAENKGLQYLAALHNGGIAPGVYTGPRFYTEAEKGSKVGSYNLTARGGEMANYAFEFIPGVISVVKRTIKVIDVDKYPLATATQGSTTRRINGVTAVYKSAAEHEVGFDMVKGKYNMSGLPVLDGDSVTVSMTVEFGYHVNGSYDSNWSALAPGEVTKQTYVKIDNTKLVSGNENYELVDNPDLTNKIFNTGRVDGRRIRSISLADASAAKLSYQYGEGLNLDGVTVKVEYETGEVEVVIPGKDDRLVIYYLPDYTAVNNEANWEKIYTGAMPGSRQAKAGDLLTVATDDTGFSHVGKYLVIAAREKDPNYDPADPNSAEFKYLQPLVVGESSGRVTPISVSPKPISYRLTANDKEYDGSTLGSGSVYVDVNQLVGDDQIYLNNGVNYNVEPIEREGAEYRFDSGRTGFVFHFADPNVAYAETPTHDNYSAYTTIPVGVSGLALGGKDAANYKLVAQNVSSSDPNAPRATITRSTKRPAPDVAGITTMSTDIHTNTVTVSVDVRAANLGDQGDLYNNELHFEYELEYLVDEEKLSEGFILVPGGDSPFFGGEPVEVVSEDFEPAEGEKDELTPGMGQSALKGDTGFGSRVPLPRDTYFRAKVRLAQTHNYEASDYTVSVSDAEMVQAVAAARAAEESDELPPTTGKPEETEPPRPIPDGQSLGKTYQYRFDVIAAQTMKGTDGEEHVRTQLDSVWFADRATYPKEEYLNALTTDPGEPRYHNYAWDPKQTQSVRFPLDMRDTNLTANLPGPDGTPVTTPVIADGTATMYVSLIPRNNGSSYIKVTILEGDLVARLGDEPRQLHAQIEPNLGTDVVWHSTDPSVVTVDENGLITFVGEGVAEIVAGFASYTDRIWVTVLPELLPEGFFNAEYLDAFMSLTDELMFYPERTVSRGELAVILAKFIYPALAKPEDAGALTYVDVALDADCAQAVELLTRLGILDGVGENHFAPEQKATRAEMAAILVRLGQLPAGEPGRQSFVDSGPEDTWAWAEIEALTQAGITDGTGDYCFSPGRLLTRAETAAFLTRMLRYKLDLSQDGLIYPADVEESYWAWAEILRAVNGVTRPLPVEQGPFRPKSRQDTRKYM